MLQHDLRLIQSRIEYIIPSLRACLLELLSRLVYNAPADNT